MKRRPLLIDEVLASKINPIWDKKRQLAHRDRLREAKVFVLDAQAARWAAEMTLKYPRAIARDQEFAIPCFPNLYIEIAAWREFYNTIQPEVRWGNDADSTVGYHISGPRAYVLTRGAAKPGGHVMPFAYKLNEPFTLEDELEYAHRLGTSRMGLDELYWGTIWNVLDNDDRRALRAQHSFEWIYGNSDAESIGLLARSAAGDLRNIIALVLFLNRTADIRYEEQVDVTRAMVHAKPSTLVRHSVVKLRLDPAPLFKRAYGSGIGVWRREHDVRGHFCHDERARTHCRDRTALNGEAHDWHEYGVNQWRCLRCGGQRWWRRACRRGSKDKGKVKTTYDVTAAHQPQRRIAA